MREDTDGEAMQANTSNSGEDRPRISVSRHAIKIALRLAEKAVDDVTGKLRDAEAERDNITRRLGALQSHIDILRGERDYRTANVRELSAALTGA